VQVGVQAPATHAFPAGQLVAVHPGLDDFALLPHPAPADSASAPMSPRATPATTLRRDRSGAIHVNSVTLGTSLPAFPELEVARGAV
jgi:hypothetical protein